MTALITLALAGCNSLVGSEPLSVAADDGPDAAPDAGAADRAPDAGAVDATPDAVPPDAAPTCGTDTARPSDPRRCFHFVPAGSDSTWVNARAECVKEHGDLANLTTAEDNAAAAALVAVRTTPTAEVWIGLTDSMTEGTWAWTSGAPFAFTAWAPNEPNGGDLQDCAKIVAAGVWGDRPCGYTLASVCDVPAR